MTVLILSYADDIHARAVEWALKYRGMDCRVVSQADFPRLTTVSAYFGNEGGTRIYEPENAEPVTHADVVWNRRISPLVVPPNAHPADTHAIQQQGNLFLKWWRASVFDAAFWINEVEAHVRGSNKLLQLKYAKAAGFNVASTLVSNEPSEIRAFLSQHGPFIAKPLSPLNWHNDEISASSYTSEVTAEDCQPNDAVQWLPMIYQQKIEKLFELRVVIMGRSIFAAKIHSQEIESASLDWRTEQSNPNLRYEKFEIPEYVRNSILKFMDAIGLVFGSMDLIVSPSGDYWFLEINEQGQFLFLELAVPDLVLLDAFTQFCASADPNFVYSRPADPVNFGAYVISKHWTIEQPARLAMHQLHTPRVSEKE